MKPRTARLTISDGCLLINNGETFAAASLLHRLVEVYCMALPIDSDAPAADLARFDDEWAKTPVWSDKMYTDIPDGPGGPPRTRRDSLARRGHPSGAPRLASEAGPRP